MKRKKTTAGELPGKVRLEVRFDADIAEGIQRVAEQTSVSLNQLMQGVMRWAIANAHPGEEAQIDVETQDIKASPQPGCIWFGHASDLASDRKGQPSPVPPEIHFQLDFTERRVVREFRRGQERKDKQR